MNMQSKALAFADKEFEVAYQKLQASPSQAERRLHAFISRALDTLLRTYAGGKQLAPENIPPVYKQMFGIEELWVLDLPPEWRFYYSISGDTIIVVDMTCDGVPPLATRGA